MNQLLGTVFTGMITDENQTHFFVQKEGQTFRLNKKEYEGNLGDTVEGFGYVDQHRRLAFTTVIPKVQVGRYAFGTVTDSRRDLGVFVDIGLPDKDIAVSLDDLSDIKQLWPKRGDKLLIAISVDEKDRMWGTMADESTIRSVARSGNLSMQNQNVTGYVYRLKLVGTFVLTTEYYIGFVHPSERYQEPRLGEEVHGRVIGVGHEGVLNLSLKPRAYEAIDDDAAMILAMLERSSTHKLPFTDKSSPEAIKTQFNISKGQFKRALGHLLKAKKIVQQDGYTHLLNDSQSEEKE